MAASTGRCVPRDPSGRVSSAAREPEAGSRPPALGWHWLLHRRGRACVEVDLQLAWLWECLWSPVSPFPCTRNFCSIGGRVKPKGSVSQESLCGSLGSLPRSGEPLSFTCGTRRAILRMSKHLEVTVTHPLDMVFQDCLSRSCWGWVPDLKERGFGFLGVLAETEGHPNTPSRSTDPRRNGGEPARGLPGEGAWDRTRLRTGYLRDGAT